MTEHRLVDPATRRENGQRRASRDRGRPRPGSSVTACPRLQSPGHLSLAGVATRVEVRRAERNPALVQGETLVEDRSHAYIDIGGNLARDRIDELAKLLTGAFDYPGNETSFEDLIREASSEGLILTFEEDNGEFGHVGIEKQLVDLGLAYDLRYESGSRYAEGEERYRPGMPEPRGFATHGGEVVVPSGIARAVIEMISHGKFAEAMTLLGVSVGDDVPKLLPLRIV